MRRIIYIFSLLFITHSVHAQGGGRGEMREKLEAARIAIITERLELTPDQAKDFWPLFNEFDDKRRELRRNFHQQRAALDMGSMSDKEASGALKKFKTHRRQEVELELEYLDKFGKVLSDKQVLALITVEDELRRRMLRRLNQRHGGG